MCLISAECWSICLYNFCITRVMSDCRHARNMHKCVCVRKNTVWKVGHCFRPDHSTKKPAILTTGHKHTYFFLTTQHVCTEDTSYLWTRLYSSTYDMFESWDKHVMSPWEVWQIQVSCHAESYRTTEIHIWNSQSLIQCLFCNAIPWTFFVVWMWFTGGGPRIRCQTSWLLLSWQPTLTSLQAFYLPFLPFFSFFLYRRCSCYVSTFLSL